MGTGGPPSGATTPPVWAAAAAGNPKSATAGAKARNGHRGMTRRRIRRPPDVVDAGQDPCGAEAANLRPSHGPQRLGRREPRRPQRRVQPARTPDRQRGGHPAGQRDPGHDDHPPLAAGVGRGDERAEHHAGEPAARRRAAPTRTGTARRRGGASRPSARRSPTSERRSSTEITMTLAIPTPPTSSATAPRPRNSDVNAVLAAARATSASDGRDTSTSSGCSGFAVAAQQRRAPARPGPGRRARRPWTGCGRSPSSRSATGNPISAACRARPRASTGSRIPTTVNQRPPIHTRDAGVVDARASRAASAPSTTVG